jgi:hypothetical protein
MAAWTQATAWFCLVSGKRPNDWILNRSLKPCKTKFEQHHHDDILYWRCLRSTIPTGFATQNVLQQCLRTQGCVSCIFNWALFANGISGIRILLSITCQSSLSCWFDTTSSIPPHCCPACYHPPSPSILYPSHLQYHILLSGTVSLFEEHVPFDVL